MAAIKQTLTTNRARNCRTAHDVTRTSHFRPMLWRHIEAPIGFVQYFVASYRSTDWFRTKKNTYSMRDFAFLYFIVCASLTAIR